MVAKVTVGQPVTGRVKYPALTVSCAQLALLLPAVLLLWAVSKVLAYSALLGGIVFILPNAYFTAYAFRYTGADSTQRVARAFYRGQSGKLALTVMGFAMVFGLVQPLHVPTLMITYCLMIASQWLIAREMTKRMIH